MRPEGLTERNISIGPPVKKGSIGHNGYPGEQGLQSHPVLDGIPGVQGCKDCLVLKEVQDLWGLKLLKEMQN